MIWFNKIFFILLIFIFLARKTTTWLIFLYLRRGMEKTSVMGGGAVIGLIFSAKTGI